LGANLERAGISTAELLRGTESDKAAEATWHFRVQVAAPPARFKVLKKPQSIVGTIRAFPVPSASPKTYDYFIDADGGQIRQIP
jgi:hypothetical protein